MSTVQSISADVSITCIHTRYLINSKNSINFIKGITEEPMFVSLFSMSHKW
jgi:hypothetical protein